MKKLLKSKSRSSAEGLAPHRPKRARILAPAAMMALAIVIAAAMLVFVHSSAAAQSAASKSKSEHSSAADVERGKKLFTSYGCYECHGRAAQGGIDGPRLGPDPPPLAFIEKFVRHPAGAMPPYTEKVVSDRDLADIYAFLKTLPEPPKRKDIPLLNH
ncbi:MAG TPA: cytochrome c [Patescibacteria group bacterium]|nr:cytochrome c [Patescibacteria group bacterium]